MWAALLAAGCGGTSTGTSNGEKSILVYAWRTAPVNNWDPAAETSYAEVLSNVYERLTHYDSKTKSVQPQLATEWSSSEGGKTWTFTVRQGVKFHDGTELDAAAVKFSIDRLVRLGVGASYIWSELDNIKTPDKYTVVFNMKRPQPVDLIASSELGAFIHSQRAVETNGDGWFAKGNEAGTGAYQLVSQEAGTKVTLERFPDYWRGWEGKHVDVAVVQYVEEPAVRRQMLEGGEAQVAYSMSADDLTALAKDPNIDIKVSGSFNQMNPEICTEVAPTDNLLVREAIAYAFPYNDAMLASAGAYGQRSVGPIPGDLWGYSAIAAVTPPLDQDLDKARELLSQAGYPNGGLKILIITISGDDRTNKVAQVLKAALSEVKIDATIRPMTSGALEQEVRAKDPRFNMCISWWWPTYASPYDTFNAQFTHQDAQKGEISYNYTRWWTKETDEMIAEAGVLSATDRKAAEELFARIWKIKYESYSSLYIYDDQFAVPIRKSLKGFDGFNAAYPNTVFFYDCSLGS
jgi:peptide/nickel transport system substrate-binding protein